MEERIGKRPYELSIWEDKIVDGKPLEIKLGVFGTQNMTSKSKALSPKLVRKVNGEITLTFDMKYRYWDDEEEKEIINPFINLLVNERKIKLFYKKKWYDLVIKQIDEDSSKNEFSYTAKSIWTNELGRQGFNLVFSEEAHNNQGTLKELAAAVLEGTDWKFDEESYSPPQYQECPLYRGFIKGGCLTCVDPLDNTSEIEIAGEIYTNYNCGKTIEIGEQIIVPLEIGGFDDDFILRGKNYIVTEVKAETQYSDITLVTGGKGKFLVSQPITKYNSVLGRYVNEYKQESNNAIIHGFLQTNYTETKVVQNLITMVHKHQ